MANYLPPTEDLPIFDDSVFEINNNPLTFNDAQKGFLAFPYAQGNETFQDIIVDGTTDFFNQVDNHSTMPPFNNATTIVPTTAWVQDAITNAPANTDINVTTSTTAGPYYMPMITGSTTGAYTGYIDSGMSYDATTNNLTTTTFTGDLVGNASTATNATTATTATTATKASNVITAATGSLTPLPLALLSTSTAGITQVQVDTYNALYYTPDTRTLASPSMYAPTVIQSGLFQTTASGLIRTYSTANTYNTSFQQVGTDLQITIPATGEMKITSQGTGVLPTATTDAGTSVLWNVSAGGGESCLVNYQDSGSAGGFDFYNVSSTSNSVKIASIPKTQSANGTSSTTIIPTYSWVNGTISDAITAISQVPFTNTSSSINYFLPLVVTSTTGNKTLFVGGSVAFNPSINTMSTSNFSASSSISSPYYTSPSGGISRWYSTDNLQYGQIWSDNTYNLYLSPAYKLALTMNTTGPSNSGAVNSINKQGCDIGWNYNGQGSTDFYNNAGIQPTTTHQAFSFWDASTALVQQAIAYIPRIQSGYGATGLNLPTYDWVNGTITAAINALPGGGALLNGGTSISNQIFTGWNTFSNLLTASAGISSIGGRNYGYTAGSNWMYIEATANVILNGGLNYFRPNSLYILEGDLTQFITTNYASGGYFRVVNTGVYTIAVQFSIINVVSTNVASIALYYGAIPSSGTSLNRNINYNSTPLNMYGSGTWTIQLTAGIDYGFLSSINSTPYNTTGTYSMSVIRIM